MEKGAINSTYIELQILKSSQNPFLAQLLYFFSTEERFYFVMPFIGGGALDKVLKQAQKFNEREIKFYGT